jgi:hypothetical protein
MDESSIGFLHGVPFAPASPKSIVRFQLLTTIRSPSN